MALASRLVVHTTDEQAPLACAALEAIHSLLQLLSQSQIPYTPTIVIRRVLSTTHAQQHALRLENTLIATPSCSGLPIPLARLEIWGHLARRPGRRAHRPTHARGDLAPRPLPLYT